MARPTLMRHRKFARLSRLIGSEVVARGSLELLWDVAYENGDPLLGSAEDVEFIARWQGTNGALTSALVESGFLDVNDGGHWVHDLWDHAPDYVRRRQAREAERQSKGKRLEATGRQPEKDSQRPVAAQSLTGQRPTNDGHCPPFVNTRAPAPAPAPTHKEEALSPCGDSGPLGVDHVSPEAAKTKPTGPTPDDLMALWNAEAHSALARCLKLTDPRRRAAKARLVDRPDLGEWREIIRRIGASSFCRGEDGGWRADFDWLVKPDTAIRVMEGKYDRAASPVRRASSVVLTKEQNALLTEEWIRVSP